MSPRARGARLLTYSQDGFGLGHLRRTTVLAAEFLSARPGASVLTVCDSPAGQFFAAAPGHDHLKLPSIRKLSPGNWSAVSLSLPFGDVLPLRREIIRSAALNYEPDVFLVDHMPHGAMGELVPTLEALERLPVKMVLGLRDILDAPVTVRRRWRLEGAFEAVERYFDEVLVYGAQDVFDVAVQYAWPPELSDRLRYCGYVCAPPAATSGDEVRQRFLNDERNAALVVAMVGGGADAHPLLDTLLRAVPRLVADRRCVVVVVTGPFLPEHEYAELQQLAHGLPVHLLRTVSDPLGYLGAADLVIAMAGYNTTAELVSLGRRALLVPRAGPSAEQRMRASRFAQRGWVAWIAPESLSPGALAHAVVEALETPPKRVDASYLRGRERAVAHLLSGLPAVTGSGTALRVRRR